MSRHEFSDTTAWAIARKQARSLSLLATALAEAGDQRAAEAVVEEIYLTYDRSEPRAGAL